MSLKPSFYKRLSLLLIAGSFIINTPGAFAAEQYISDNSVRQDPVKAQKQQGNLSVGEFTGAGIYDYPLPLPQGRNGMTPKLSLTQNSQDTFLTNLVGYKWSLTDYSIKRLNTHGVETFYDQNGKVGLNDFIVNTPISSGELISTKLFDDHHGIYSEKNESTFSQYEYKPDGSWVMTYRNGTKYTFGLSPETRQFDLDDPTHVYQWMLEEMRDSNDNFISYTYQKIDNQVYPKSIRYTGHGQEAGVFEVKFLVDTQQKRQDSQFSYASGFLVTTNYLINAIEVYADEKLRSKYELTYGTIDPLIRKVLTGVTETGYDLKGVATALPPTTFEYTPSVISWKETEQYKPLDVDFAKCTKGVSCSTHQKAFFWDITGDGLVDIPQNNNQNPLIYINDAKGGWTQKPKGTYFLPPGAVPYITQKLLDFEGDIKNDFLLSYLDPNNSKIIKSLLQLSSQPNVNDSIKVSLQGSNNNNFYDNGGSIADLNGDGLPDIIQSRSKTDNTDPQATCLNKDGNSCALTNLWKSPEKIIVDNIEYQYERKVYVEDCNADGLADVYYSGAPTARKWLNDGKGGWIKAGLDQNCQFTDLDGLFYRSTDLNTDGLTDHVMARINAGNELVINQLQLNTGATILPDVGNFPLLFGRGSGTGQSNADQSGVRIMDINGDLLPDVVQSYTEMEQKGNNWIYTYKKHVYLHNGSRPYFLKTIHTSTGSEINLEYKTSAQYLRADESQANPKLPIIVDTVSKVSVTDGLGGVSSTNYLYEDGHYYFKNSYEKGFSGFGTVTKTDGLGLKTKTFYHQGEGSVDGTSLGEYQDDVTKKGQVFRAEIYDQNNNLLSKTINRIEHKVIAANHFFPFLSQTSSQTLDGDILMSTAQSYKYDEIGNKIETIDYGEVTAQGEDGSFSDTGTDLIKTIITVIAQTAYPFENKTIDAADKLLSQTRIYYDSLPLGQVDKGNLSAQENWLDTDDSWVKSEMKFDAYGLPIASKNPRGFMSTMAYDTYHLYAKELTNAKGHVTQVKYDPASGQTIFSKDPNGMVQETLYDGFNRPVEIKENGTLISTTAYSDDTLPRWTFTQAHNDDGENVDQYTYFDALDRVVETKAEAAGGKWTTSQVIYDERGNVKKQIQPYFSDSSAFEALSLEKIGTEIAYDGLDRPLTMKNPLGTTTTSYKGFETTVVDSQGKPKTLTFDARKNLIRVDEKNGEAIYQTHYTYDLLNRLLTTLDAKENLRTYAYDSLGRQLSMSQFNSKDKWAYEYDLNDNLIQKLDPKNQKTSYVYDELDRVILEAGEDKNDYIEYAYDKGDFARGRLAQASKIGYSHDLNYDIYGRVILDIKMIEDKQFNFGYTYDQLGAIRSIQYPDGAKVEYVYDEAHQLKEVKSGDQIYAQNFDYLPMGQVGHMSLGTSIEINNTYDPAKLYQLTGKKALNGPAVLQDYTYTYDSLGNLTKLMDANGGLTAKTVDYTYDDLSRLTGSNYTQLGQGEDFSDTYAYDAIGNMMSKSDVGNYTYNSPTLPHAVTTAGEHSYEYDANGNMTMRDQIEMVYDSQDRLLHSGKQARFFYGEGSDRVMKVSPETNEKTYYPDKLFEVEADKEIKYIYSGEARIAKIEKPLEAKEEKLYYMLTDHLDSIDTVLDKEGKVVERQDYSDFGEERITDSSKEAPETNKGYTGKELDEETGLNYYGARYYDSEIGRFTSVDPWEGELTDPQSLNKYSYVLNNPLKYNDPTGEYASAANAIFRISTGAVSGAVKFISKVATREAAHVTNKTSIQSAKAPIKHVAPQANMQRPFAAPPKPQVINPAPAVASVAPAAAPVQNPSPINNSPLNIPEPTWINMPEPAGIGDGIGVGSGDWIGAGIVSFSKSFGKEGVNQTRLTGLSKEELQKKYKEEYKDGNKPRSPEARKAWNKAKQELKTQLKKFRGAKN